MKKIIEDTISRNREFREKRNSRVKRLKELKAPPALIEYEEMLAEMTIVEYEIHIEQLEKEDAEIKVEYAKNNPIQKHIVDEIYNRVEKLEYDFFTYNSNFNFSIAIDPLNFMSNQDFENDLYTIFLNHAHKMYNEKYLVEHTNYEKSKGLGVDEK